MKIISESRHLTSRIIKNDEGHNSNFENKNQGQNKNKNIETRNNTTHNSHKNDHTMTATAKKTHIDIYNLLCDEDYLLNEKDDENKEFTHINNITHTCPEIEIEVGGLLTTALLDTGCEITCLSQNWFHEHHATLNTYPRIPVQHLTLKTANGQHTQRIKELTLIPTRFKHITLNIQYLVVPKLTKNIILGIDTLHLLHANIDIDTYTITLAHKDITDTIIFNKKHERIRTILTQNEQPQINQLNVTNIFHIHKITHQYSTSCR